MTILVSRPEYYYPDDIDQIFLPGYKQGNVREESMTDTSQIDCTAFEGTRRIASGKLAEVAREAKEAVDRGGDVLLFNNETSQTIELDFRGTPDDVARRLSVSADGFSAAAEPAPRGPGRPRLGVVAREITLLPRHWEWLNSQPGGASVALRKLVEQARRAGDGNDSIRRSQEAAYRFMSAMAGNLPGFEEAARALFAGQGERFDRETASWPPDVRDHARGLAANALHRTTP
jgi:hypothetical protein